MSNYDSDASESELESNTLIQSESSNDNALEGASKTARQNADRLARAEKRSLRKAQREAAAALKPLSKQDAQYLNNVSHMVEDASILLNSQGDFMQSHNQKIAKNNWSGVLRLGDEIGRNNVQLIITNLRKILEEHNLTQMP